MYAGVRRASGDRRGNEFSDRSPAVRRARRSRKARRADVRDADRAVHEHLAELGRERPLDVGGAPREEEGRTPCGHVFHLEPVGFEVRPQRREVRRRARRTAPPNSSGASHRRNSGDDGILLRREQAREPGRVADREDEEDARKAERLRRDAPRPRPARLRAAPARRPGPRPDAPRTPGRPRARGRRGRSSGERGRPSSRNPPGEVHGTCHA